MSLITTLSQATLPVLPVLRGLAGLSFLAAFAVFFKPLLFGIGRAFLLLLNPRLSKEQKAARRNMRNAKLIQRMIKESNCPGLAAELRAIGARS